MEHTHGSPTAVLLGSSAAIALAGLIAPARDWIGTANVALLLAVVVVVTAAFSDRRAAAVTGITAALAYNFFDTRPYYTLRVDDRVDLTTVVLLLLVGLVCGELAVLRHRQTDRSLERAADVQRIRELLAMAAQGDAALLITAASTAVRDELGLSDCRYEAVGSESGTLVHLERNGGIDVGALTWTADGFQLPPEGVQLDVVRGTTRLGRFVLVPTPGRGVPLERRRVAVAIADLVAVAQVSPAPRPM